MNFITQTKFGMPEGNCFQACIASILGFELETLPCYHNELNNKQWWMNWQNWLACHGYGCSYFVYPPGTQLDQAAIPAGVGILSGKSPRGNFLHATVFVDGKMAHDPHPDRTGVLNVEDFVQFWRLEDMPKWAIEMREG